MSTPPNGAPGVAAEPLDGWLRSAGLLSPSDPPAIVTQLAGGSSNITASVRSGPHDWVLRRPPVRGALPNAHDMLREYRLQAALSSAGTGLPLATMVAPCDDLSVIGAPFYLMERLTGRVHTVASLTPLSDATVHTVGLALVDALAELHTIDPEKVDAMAEFLRPEPYADRQLRRWAGQWERARAATGLGGEPTLDHVFSWLTKNRPPVPPPRVVHGDYGFANVMFDADEVTTVQAILDWELTAVGDALSDLGSLIAYQSEAGRLMNSGRPDPVCHRDLLPALPTVPELVERYAQRSGDAGVAHVSWYVTFAVTKLAVIVAGALNRLDPATDEERRARSARMVHDLAVAAEAELERGSP
jgi:aminoglycoside phosphotransferase (APT) family kinase protein